MNSAHFNIIQEKDTKELGIQASKVFLNIVELF